MKDLERIQVNLVKSNTLVMKDKSTGLECIFIREGMEVDHFTIDNDILADALSKTGVRGIVEGNDFRKLKNDYARFSLKVKSKALYQELQQMQA